MTNERRSDDEKLTIADAAELLRVSKGTVQNAIKEGLLKPVHGGLRARRAYWVTRESVETLKANIGGWYA